IIHHGTLLINSHLNRLELSLKGNRDGITTHAVESKSAHVINLSGCRQGLTPDAVRNVLICEFYETWGGSNEDTPLVMDIPLLDNDGIKGLYVRNSSWDWLFGRTPAFVFRVPALKLGTSMLSIFVEKGMVHNISCPNKTLEDGIRALLVDKRFDIRIVTAAVDSIFQKQ
ncbi:MAG: hypothetical protein AB1798_24035, partial [Spirochaetota bacterium]